MIDGSEGIYHREHGEHRDFLKFFPGRLIVRSRGAEGWWANDANPGSRVTGNGSRTPSPQSPNLDSPQRTQIFLTNSLMGGGGVAILLRKDW